MLRISVLKSNSIPNDGKLSTAVSTYTNSCKMSLATWNSRTWFTLSGFVSYGTVGGVRIGFDIEISYSYLLNCRQFDHRLDEM